MLRKSAQRSGTEFPHPNLLSRDCRSRFARTTSLNGVLTQSFPTNRYAFRWLFLRSSTQSSTRFARCNVIQSGSIKRACVAIFLTLLKLISRSRIKKACHFRDKLCELAGTRTQGPYIKSVLLYQLSYQF